MSMSTETVQIGTTPVVVPVYFNGEKLPDVFTATQLYDSRMNRGVLLWAIGVRGSRLMPQDWNVDIRNMFERELDASGASFIAKLYHRTDIMAGPTMFVMEKMTTRQQWVPIILRSLTPLLVPDHVHLEHLEDALKAAHIPADLLHNAVAKVCDVRHQAQFMAA